MHRPSYGSIQASSRSPSTVRRRSAREPPATPSSPINISQIPRRRSQSSIRSYFHEGELSTSAPLRELERRITSAKYRDAQEQAQQEADPEHWQVLMTPALTTAANSGFLSQVPPAPRNSLFMDDVNEQMYEEPMNVDTIPEPRQPVEEVVLPDESHFYQSVIQDTDEDDEEDIPVSRIIKETKTPWYQSSISAFPLSPLQKSIIKCVTAYFIGELFTFVPFLSRMVGAPLDSNGPVRNAHVIATVAVYFNPAKTIGAMFEADIFTVLGFCYAVFLVWGSMGMTVLLFDYGYSTLSRFLVPILWIGGGYTYLAYVKVKVNKPTFSTTCSLVSLICSVIITKEGAYQIGKFDERAIEQVFIIVVIGTLISNTVCFTLWPTSATTKLQNELNKTLASFSTLLDMLIQTFLLEETSIRPENLKKAIDAHHASFTTLKASLHQAGFETFVDSRIRGTTQTYEQAVSSMTKLAQGLTALRSGCILQFDLANAMGEGVFDNDKNRTNPELAHFFDEMFVLTKFKEKVGGSLKQVSQDCKRALALLRQSFLRTRSGTVILQALRDDSGEEGLSSQTLDNMSEELFETLMVFKKEHSEAIKNLYQRLPTQALYGGSFDLSRDQSSLRNSPGGPNETIFKLYYFCQNMEEWVRDLCKVITIFADLREIEENIAKRHIELEKNWGCFFKVVQFFDWVQLCVTPRRAGKPAPPKRKSIKDSVTGVINTSRITPESPFPQIVEGSLSAHQTPLDQMNGITRFKYRFWRLLWHIKQPDIRFALKTGIGAAVLASTAFLDITRPYWLKWRGEWALISYMVIMAPSVGSTNFLAFGRVLGTIVGAVAAVIFSVLFPDNPVVLPFLGAIFSIPCFYVIITRPQFGPSSRFVLLTFNLTCLYCYNLREGDVDVINIAFHRSIAVVFGVLFGLVINSYLLPIEARRELLKGLSEFFLDAAYLYECIVRKYSCPPPALKSDHTLASVSVDERTALLSAEAKEDIKDAVEDFIVMEVYLQLRLIRLSGLVEATRHEPRLKGPFPVATYKTVLSNCQNILDLLSAIRVTTTQEQWYTSVRRDFVIPCNTQRREMVGNVLLFFSILASVVINKMPLPAYLPPAEKARERLVKKLKELHVVRKRIVRGGSESLLYLAYALSMKEVIAQLEALATTFQSLFGIIGGVPSIDAFESLFSATEDERQSFEESTPVDSYQNTDEDSE